MNQTVSNTSVSTSRHLMSADFGLTKFQRIWWLLYNIANNTFPNSAMDPRMVERNFRLNEHELERLWPKITGTASPARRLCDLFWMTMPWQKIAQELPTAQILEIGCGNGVYGRLLQQCMGENFAHYLGVDMDACDEWESIASPQFSFAVGRAEAAHQFLSGRNLILTQSALEHFEEDLTYFKHVAEFVAAASEPVLQVHLVPSAGCLLTFPWHGVREYTPRTLSKVSRLFDDRTRVRLYALGGARCNKVHRQYITWPNFRHHIDLRHTRNDEYQGALREAIIPDVQGNVHKPAFYALVLMSNFANDPFAP